MVPRLQERMRKAERSPTLCIPIVSRLLYLEGDTWSSAFNVLAGMHLQTRLLAVQALLLATRDLLGSKTFLSRPTFRHACATPLSKAVLD